MMPDLAAQLKKCRRIVVVKLRYVGDSVWSLLFLENLKANLPDAQITVVANSGTDGFFYHNDYVHQVIPYPNRKIKKGGMAGIRAALGFARALRRVKADAVIELTDSNKASVVSLLAGAGIRVGFYQFQTQWRHRLLNYVFPMESKHWVPLNFDLIEAMGLRVVHREIHNKTPESAFVSLREKCPPLFKDDGRKKVLVHPGARVALRQWGTDRFAELCDLLNQRFSVFLTAGPDETALVDQVVQQMKSVPAFASSALSLQEFAALAQTCDLFVGNDSGPIHIAATKTFTVGIYGPNNDEFAGPWTSRKYIFDDPV